MAGMQRARAEEKEEEGKEKGKEEPSPLVPRDPE
jgi:hypothetical protein